MTGDPVLAYPNTLTGSIGVLDGKANLHGLYDKLGIKKELLSRGKYADIDSDYTPLSDAGRQKLHEGILSTYKSFVTKVASARRKTYDQIDPLAQGRVWMGDQARGNGLVDELGGLDRAMQLIRERARLPQSEILALVPFPGTSKPAGNHFQFTSRCYRTSRGGAQSTRRNRRLAEPCFAARGNVGDYALSYSDQVNRAPSVITAAAYPWVLRRNSAASSGVVGFI